MNASRNRPAGSLRSATSTCPDDHRSVLVNPQQKREDDERSDHANDNQKCGQ